jgi:hypothetical protein
MMNDLAKKLIAFHLGDSNVHDLTSPERGRLGIDPGFIEPKLNNLAETAQMEIVGDVDNAIPDQVVVCNDIPVATRNSILGRCIETYDGLVQKHGLQGNAVDIRRKIMQRYRGMGDLGRQYVMSREQLSESMGRHGSYNL